MRHGRFTKPPIRLSFLKSAMRAVGAGSKMLGVRSLILKMKKLKAFEIPDVLVEALLVDLSEAEINKYHEIRDIRNGVAHGDPVTLTMRQAVEMNGVLRDLAQKISSHLAEHFFVIEKYVPGNLFSV